MADAVVRLQALDGQWEMCGVDRLRGVVPEGLAMSANDWGSDRASFTLKRSPGAVWPDLSAFTPVDIEIDGTLVWSGRVKETPTRDGSDSSVSVECEGWQYHLDDDVYRRNYVHTRLGDFVDMRSMPNANLATYTAAWEVSAGNGALYMGLPAATTAANGTSAGVLLDTGDDVGAKRIVVTYMGGGHASLRLRLRTYTETAAFTASTNVDIDAAPIATAQTTVATTVTPATRWIELVLQNNAGASMTGTETAWVRIYAVQVFRDTTYESGNASILTADVIVRDARDAGTVLLSTSNDRVEAQTFAIPEMYLDGQRTPREVIQAANAYEDCQASVDVFRRVVFRDRPTNPLFEVGNWAGVEFEDASANSGEEIYNQVIVEGVGPDERPLTVLRSAAELTGAQTFFIATPAPDNPSFDVNTTSWSVSGGGGATLARDTTVFDSTPAAGKWTTTVGSGGETLTETFTGTFSKGVTYVLTFRFRLTLAASQGADGGLFQFVLGTATDYATTVIDVLTNAWTTYSVVWSPDADRSGVSFRAVLIPNTGATAYSIDTLALRQSAATLVDRRVFRRTKILPVAAAGIAASYSQIGDLWLQGHRTTPLKGSAIATGRAVRRVLGGEGVHPAKLLTQTGEMVRLAHRIDPDTGGHGRDARIAAVSYNHDDQAGTIELDNRRSNFEALLERLAIVTGQL